MIDWLRRVEEGREEERIGGREEGKMGGSKRRWEGGRKEGKTGGRRERWEVGSEGGMERKRTSNIYITLYERSSDYRLIVPNQLNLEKIQSLK